LFGLFFDAMSPVLRRRLFSKAQRRLFKPNATIFSAGTVGASMLLIETGRVEVSIHNSDGRKTVLNHLGPGDLLGEFSFLDGGLRSADVIAAVHTTGLEFSHADMRATLLAEPEAMLALLVEVCRKARDTINSVESLSHKHAMPRLAQCLIRLCDKWGTEVDGSTVIAQDFSQGDLGEIAGLARENVNRLLKAWAADGILIHEDGRLVVIDRQALDAIAHV